jgi:hypothetical protein
MSKKNETINKKSSFEKNPKIFFRDEKIEIENFRSQIFEKSREKKMTSDRKFSISKNFEIENFRNFHPEKYF